MNLALIRGRIPSTPVLRQISFALMGSLATRGSMLCLTILGVRLLSTDDYGRFAYYLGVIASLGTVAAMGTGVTLNMYLARHGGTKPVMAQKLVFASVITTSAMTVIVSFVSFSIFQPENTLHSYNFTLGLTASILVWLLGLSGIAEGALNGLGLYRRLATNGAITLGVTGAVAAIAMGIWGFWGAMMSLTIFRLTALSLNAIHLRSKGLLPLRIPLNSLRDAEIISTFQRVSLPAMLGGVMVGPVFAISLAIAREHPDGFRGIAYFSWIQQLYLMAVFIPGALGGFFVTRLSQAADQAVAGRLMMGNAIFAMLVSVLFYVLKPWLLGFAGFQESPQASHAFDLMTVAILLYCLNASFASYWPATGQGWKGFAANLLWAVLFLSTVGLGVHSLGAVALALAYVVAYSGQLLAQVAFYKLVNSGTTK